MLRVAFETVQVARPVVEFHDGAHRPRSFVPSAITVAVPVNWTVGLP